tara:strand:- start:4124 stop:6142 length:2019 start_codon:yes stop_codon:yes gene_type:complete
MAIVAIEKVGQIGIAKETSPWELPSNVWSDGNNVKTDEGSIRKSPGFSEVMATCPVAPYHITQITLGTPEFWIVGGLAKIYCYDNTGTTTTLDGSITSSDTTITVDSTVGFESAGTITIGAEDIVYTGKTTTTFTGATVTSSHTDGATVTRSTIWYDITRASGGDYSSTANDTWTSTILGGVLVMTNFYDKPQYWALTDGTVLSSQKMQDLNNWPALTQLNGAITGTGVPSPDEIIVDSTIDFPTAGTFTVDTEDISYTGKTSTKFTGIGRGENGTTAATHLDNAPAFITTYCRSMRGFRSFLVALNLKQAGVNFPRVVKWSTEASIQTTPTSWNETTSTVDAGEYELADTKGDIMDGMQLRDAFMIYKEDAVYSMTYVGTPFIFSFRQLSPTVGAIATNCIAEFDGGHAIFGKGNFYVNDGQRLKPILPQRLRDYVFTSIDGAQIEKCFVAADYGRTEILFCFTADGAPSAEPNKAVVWNYITNTFTIKDIPDVAHMGYGNVGDPVLPSTWASATTSWATITGPWTMSYALQDKVLLFADPINTKLYRDRSGNKKNTALMTSYVERTGLSLNAQGQPDHTGVKRISAIYPKMSINGSNSITVYLGTSMSTEGGYDWKDAVLFNPDTQSKVSVRGTGKFYAVKFESSTDMDWELDGYALDIDNAGNRGSRQY